jgi:hypothetical protein
MLDRDELRDRDTFFRDDYRLAALAHLVHYAQAVGLELARRDRLRHGQFQMTIVVY